MPKVVPEYKQEAKARIVQAARVVFAKKGYHEATMDDVAKEIGVSKGALYSYFSSKEDLIKEISSQGHQALRSILTETAECADLREALEKAYSAVAEQFKGNLHTHFEVLALSSHDPQIKRILTEDYRKDAKAIEAFVEEKKRQGYIRTDIEPQVLAELFTALYLDVLAKLVMGYPNQEIHNQWIKSMTLILSEPKTLGSQKPKL